nr:hypothetical protein [Rhizobium laguerreae]
MESIRFSDGTIWSKQDIAAHISVVLPEGIAGTVGRETLEGTRGDDLIIGFEGNDTFPDPLATTPMSMPAATAPTSSMTSSTCRTRSTRFA